MNKRIREIREYFHISQTKFAEKLGMTRSMISNMELDLAEIPDYRIKAICKTYNINENWLRTGEGEMLNQSETVSLDALAEQNNLDDLSRAIVEEFIKMPLNARQAFHDLVHAVADKVRTAQYSESNPEDVAQRILKDDVFSEMKSADAAGEQLQAE